MIDRNTRQAHLERRRSEQRRSQLKWIVYIVIGAVVVVVLLIVSNLARTATIGPVSTPLLRSYGQQSGNVLGDPNAPVKLIEVGDFQCPVCQAAFQTLEEPIITTYVNSGKVSYTFEAINVIGPESIRSAEAAYCAGDQNKFWEYHDYLYSNQGAENGGSFSDDRLMQFAQLLGLDMNKFTPCFQNGETANRVTQAQAVATQYGINATPSFVVNGKVFVGLISLTEMQQAIDAALAAAGAN